MILRHFCYRLNYHSMDDPFEIDSKCRHISVKKNKWNLKYFVVDCFSL